MLQLILISFKIGLNIFKVMQPSNQSQPTETIVLEELSSRCHELR